MNDAPVQNTPPTNLGFLLGSVKAELTHALEQELAAHDLRLRFSQFQTLMRLDTFGTTSPGALARSLNYDGGAMTRLLDQLEGHGYVCRRPDPDDRRAQCIELTDSGHQLCRTLANCSQRMFERTLADLDSEEQDRLVDYLQRMLATLQQPH